MKQVLLSIPAIIENETRMSWFAIKVLFIAAVFASIGFSFLE